MISMTCRVLITGADGFVASHLADFVLSKQNVEVFGTIRRMADKKNIQHILKDIHLVEMELTDYHSVHNAMKMAEPDKIFHLAGQTFVPTSWTAPALTFEVNAVGTIHMLEALRNVNKEAYMQIAGSSEEYGFVAPEECPITEEHPLRPLSPYGVSKVAADMAGYQYQRSYGLNIVRTRSFNMTGPRRGEEFVDSNFAKQIVEMEMELREPKLLHGNLDAIREFTDVRDSVRAYWMLSCHPKPGEVFNVCSGVGISMKEVLDTIFQNETLCKLPVLEVDPTRLRPSDVPRLIGDPTKLMNWIGWEPEYSYPQSVSDLLDYWRERLRGKNRG
jgi:GDP-4-dehydro-6-deoxy-D-mannose reductase